MFVRKKVNRAGSVSVLIIDKSHGYKVVKTVGVSRDQDEIKRLVATAEQIIGTNCGRQRELFESKEEVVIENFLKGLSNAQIRTVGPELIFGTLFDRVGFGEIKDELFRHVVVARLAYPTSKLKTVDYLYRYKGINVSADSIYRFLDRLKDRYKQRVEQIAFEYTKRTLKNIAVVFYDMTTLYFEAEDEDDLRKIGFSKDGKFQQPQIMLGLLVGENGYPIGYDIFEGNVFEGHTLLPVLEGIRKKFHFPNPVVVADAALLSGPNLSALRSEGYEFIIGARIRNESAAIKKKVLERAEDIKAGHDIAIEKPNGTRLIMNFSAIRQKKDAYNRDRGVRKLKERIRSGKLTKEQINNRGYNKFLTLKGVVEVAIDEAKVAADEAWDGLKGYITNTSLPAEKVISNYRHLWQIEKAFRISKTDLRIRPVHHYRKKRIEAHICIAFVAYAIYKELERLLDEHKAGFSPRRATELTQNMYQIEYRPQLHAPLKRFVLKMDQEQQVLFDVIHKLS